MPLIVLLDASSPQTSEQVPLSWWCAAELAQWPSAAMATDVFQLTLTRHLRRMSREEKLNSSNSEVVQPTSYIIRDSIKHSSNNNSKRAYLFLPFPQTIKAANKYFTTEIHLLCGFYHQEQEVHDYHNTTSNEQNISQQEEQILNCTLLNDNNNNNNNNSNDIIHNHINKKDDDGVNVFMSEWDEIVSEYTMCNESQRWKESELLNMERLQGINYNNAGVIYLTSSAPHLELPSAIWEMFTHSTSAIKAVMYFSRETEKHNNKCKEKGNVSRWRDVCVDKEIELIVHDCEEISNSKFEQEQWHERDGSKCGNVINNSCSGHNNIMWEKVNANVGKLGILSFPVTGTNRLMQLLAQTPWPEQLEEEECEEQEYNNSNTIHSMESQTSEKKRTHSTSVATPLTDSSEPQNVFLVVTDCVTATIDAFVQEEHTLSDFTNKWIERFYTVKGKSAHCSQRHKYNNCNNNDSNTKQELVLVNRYYSASVYAHHMHYYWFHPSMAQMCQEKLISLTQTDGFALHAYVFATSEMYKSLVTSPETSSAICTEKHWQPSLHKIVSELQLYNMNVVIVVISDDNESSIGVNSKECSDVQNNIVLKEKAEVIWLNSENVNKTRFEEYEQHEEGHETHGCDRLRETLHCVDWKYKLHRAPSHAMPHVLCCSKSQMPQHNNNTEHVQTSVGMNKKNNTCLLSVFGESAEKEEQILYKLLSECFNFDFSSALSPCVQRNKYKSIVSMVPSLLFQRVDEHGMYVNMGPCVYNISNKYMTATVKIDVLGGICTRQDVYCENALELRVSEYDALLVCCTFEALSRAAAIGVAATANTSVNNWDNTNNVDTISVLLCHAIQSLQSIAEKEFDSMTNNISSNKSNDWNTKEIDLEHVEEHVMEEEFTASPLMALFVIDVPAEDTIIMEKALKLINTIISSSNTNNSDRAITTMNEQHEYDMSTSQSDEKMYEESMESNILFEVIFAECKENQTTKLENELRVSSTEEEEDTFTTHGITRVREMMEQHCWRVRKEIKQSAYSSDNDSTHDTSAKVMEHQESLWSNDHTHQISEEDVIKDNDKESSPEEELNTFQRATCALPPDYLIDPETLRSTPVRVLRYVQQCQRCHANTLKNDKITNEKYKEWNKGTLEYAHEIQMWMTKMNKYGHRLTKTQRQEQAAVLASALEYIDVS